MTNTPIQPINSTARDQGYDALLLAAFDRRNMALQAAALAEKAGDDNAERSFMLSVCDAEKQLIEMTATTPKGAAAQLWAALYNAEYDKDLSAAMVACDLPALEANADKLEYEGQLMLAALRSLTNIVVASEGESMQ